MTEPNVHRIRSGVIDDRLVFDAIERELGVRPACIELRETQAPRLVYEATFDQHPPVIFKAEVDTAGDEALVLEAWAIEQVRALGVPAPRVITLDSSASRFPGRYLILEKVSGLPLPPIWRERGPDEADLTPDQLRAVLRSTGEHLHLVHSIIVAGYGRLDDERYLRTGDVRGQHDSWSGVLLPPALAALDYLEPQALIARELCAALRNTLETHAEILHICDDPRLLHGDLGTKHIFVDRLTAAVTGIIDWGDRESGDPAMELAGC